MNSDGDNEHQITDMGAGRAAWNPILARDGNKIAFEAPCSDLPWANSIDVINIDSSGQTTVINPIPSNYGNRACVLTRRAEDCLHIYFPG